VRTEPSNHDQRRCESLITPKRVLVWFAFGLVAWAMLIGFGYLVVELMAFLERGLVE
jgi:hypothetical protein